VSAPPQFLLEVEEVAGLAKQLEAWRRDIYQPLAIEVSGTQTFLVLTGL
jgi:hypothetical protein